jgi:molybdopterin synthase catalytic subunit
MILFTPEPIDPRKAYELIGKKAAGSVLFHFAVAKAMGAKHGITTHITYERNGDVETNLREIETELREKWDLEDVLLLRREGRVSVGEIISLVAVSSPASEAAFAACRHGIACLKRMATIRKTEVYS